MFVAFADLWLPIALSAVAVFVVSALAWMVMPHHKNDFSTLPNEDVLMGAIRQQNLAAGMYAFPDCKDHSKMKDPAFKAKMEAGPIGMLNVWPPNAYSSMGPKMLISLIFYLVVSAFVAYLGSRALDAGSDFKSVFSFTSVAAVMAYCFAGFPNDIWFSKPYRAMATCLIDGLAYGLITGLMFGLMWP